MSSPWEICTCTGNERCSNCPPPPSPLDIWLEDLIALREGETDEQHLDRIKAALTVELDDDV